MNYKNIIFVLARLISIEGIFLILSSLVALYYHQDDFLPLLLTGFGALIGGIAVAHPFRHEKGKLGRREGYFIVTTVWIVFSLVGALPFYISGYIPSFTDAFFETISGFTTTGASILIDIEALPYGLLFWRSLIQWLGGMGIIVLSLAVLPILGIGGMQLFIAEVPGPTKDKLHPRIQETAKRLWHLYLGYTVVETILLYYGGMSLYDAVCHSFTTMATGGYSTKQASIAYFNSPFIEYVIIAFMFIAGVNFSLGFHLFNLKFGKIRRNEEFIFYTLIILVVTAIITKLLYAENNFKDFEEFFRQSLFQVVSLMTTTGFATQNYLQWPSYVTLLLVLLMFIGGSAGSTGGGIKVIRVLIVIKNSFLELKRLIHPNAVIPIKYNGHSLPDNIVKNILAFIVFYIIIFVISTILVCAMGYDLETSIGAVAATLGNIGPGIGEVGPVENFAHFPDYGKWFLSFLMLIGRLELFTVLVLFTKAYWKN